MFPVTPPRFRTMRWPGQVPSKEKLQLQKQAQQKAPPIEALNRFDKPVIDARSIVSDFGWTLDKIVEWESYIQHALLSSANELEFRKTLMIKAFSEGIEPIVRNLIGVYGMQYWRQMRKSSFYIDLEKAEARGGNYYKRVPSGKGYRYFYNEDQYHQSKGAHLDGERAQGGYLVNKVKVLLTTNKGTDHKIFKGLVKKYGIDKIESVLKGCQEKGNLKIEKGKFYWQEKKKEGARK